MSEKGKIPAKKDNSATGGSRRKSFRLDEDVVLGMWAEHNKNFKSAADKYDEQAKFEAYYEFCYKVFCGLTDTAIAAKYNGSAPNRIKDFPERLGGVLDKSNSTDVIKDIVFKFMFERLSRKAEDLLPLLQRQNSAIQLPFGQEWAGWMWSDERTWQNRASLFDTSQ